MSDPRMSVVMPVYNVAAYVAEAVQSVPDQSFADFELVIVDDGGTDRSMDIVRQFRDPHPHRVAGQSRPRGGAQHGHRACPRALYRPAHSDDRWHVDKLLLHYVHLQANPHVGVSYAGSRMIDANGDPLAVAMKPRLSNVTARDILCRNPVGNGSAAVLRRSALNRAAFAHPDEAGRVCWFDESFRQSEDIELWVRLSSAHGVTFEGIAGLLTDYRIIGGALSANVVNQYLSWTRMLDIAARNARAGRGPRRCRGPISCAIPRGAHCSLAMPNWPMT